MSMRSRWRWYDDNHEIIWSFILFVVLIAGVVLGVNILEGYWGV